MGNKTRVRPGLSSPDPSQDVEYTIDTQIDDGQHERDEYAARGPLGPPRMAKRYPSKHKQTDADEEYAKPDWAKQHRGRLP